MIRSVSVDIGTNPTDDRLYLFFNNVLLLQTNGPRNAFEFCRTNDLIKLSAHRKMSGFFYAN